MRLAKWQLVPVIMVLALVMLSSACSSPAAPAPAPTTSAQPSATSSQADMVQAAIKEGSLNWIDAVVVAESAQKMTDAFKKAYGLPDSFKVNFERLGTGPLASRIQEEVKASRVTVDVFAIADPVLFYDLKNAGALLRYDSPQYKFYTRAQAAGLTYEPGYWQSAIAYVFSPIVNPKVYSKVITSWTDLLGADLKGKKIDWPTPAQGQSPLYVYIALKSVLPPTYFPDLVKQDLTTGTSSVEQLQKLAQGETLVTITNPFRIVQTAAQTGVNLATYFPKEGVPLLGHPYGILAQSPHPNAAKLFIDWLYGEQGMKMYVDLESIIVIRDGAVTPDAIKKFSPALADIKGIPLDWKSMNSAMLDKTRTEALAIFGK